MINPGNRLPGDYQLHTLDNSKLKRNQCNRSMFSFLVYANKSRKCNHHGLRPVLKANKNDYQFGNRMSNRSVIGGLVIPQCVPVSER